MKAIFSNVKTWGSPAWEQGCPRQDADRVILISDMEPHAWGIQITQATEDKLRPADLPEGWDDDEANAAIDRLLGER